MTSIKQRIILNQTEIPINLKRATPNIRDFEFSIGSGIRTENSGVHLTQYQKRYMINYWKLKNSERKVTGGGSSAWKLSKEIDRSLRDLQTLQDNKIKTAEDLSERLHEMEQLKSSTRKQLQALRSNQEDSETKKFLMNIQLFKRLFRAETLQQHLKENWKTALTKSKKLILFRNFYGDNCERINRKHSYLKL